MDHVYHRAICLEWDAPGLALLDSQAGPALPLPSRRPPGRTQRQRVNALPSFEALTEAFDFYPRRQHSAHHTGAAFESCTVLGTYLGPPKDWGPSRNVRIADINIVAKNDAPRIEGMVPSQTELPHIRKQRKASGFCMHLYGNHWPPASGRSWWKVHGSR